jgi:protein SMG6
MPLRVVQQNVTARVQLQLMPGYTILVMDTNILLSFLAMVISLVESLRWIIVVPLPAVMELDGLAANASPFGEAAKAAIAFVVSRVCKRPGATTSRP